MILLVITCKLIGGIISGITMPIFFYSGYKQYRGISKLNKIYQLPLNNTNYSGKKLKQNRSQTVNENEIFLINQILFYGKLKNIFWIPFFYILFEILLKK